MSNQYPPYPGSDPEGSDAQDHGADGAPPYGATPPPPHGTPPPYGTPPSPYGTPPPPPQGQHPHGQFGQYGPGHAGAGQGGFSPDPYAHWGLRFAGYLLDGLIACAVYLPLYFVGFAFLMADADPYGEPAGGPLTVVGVVVIFLSLAVVLGFSFWNYGIRQGRTGQTLGKQIVAIRVVKTDGTPLGTWLSIGRTLLFSVLTTCTCYINVLWPLWDQRKQALHDKVVDSVVIKA